jgi:hypothetical protein
MMENDGTKWKMMEHDEKIWRWSMTANDGT